MAEGPVFCASWREFLETVSPGAERMIGQLFTKSQGSSPRPGMDPVHWIIPETDILVPCPVCEGERIFQCASGTLYHSHGSDHFLQYVCGSCRESHKTYAVRIRRPDQETSVGIVWKFGESPSFGPSLPGRLLTLLRDDVDLLAKGRQAENQSMGIAAFAYYRRVVENQRQHLFEELARVAERLDHSEGVVGLFRRAAREDQFMKGVELVRDALPMTLMIEGRNPILLLHAALSDGLHDRSDEECLELANDIRVVLAALAERVTEALADRQELKSSIARLAARIARATEINA